MKVNDIRSNEELSKAIDNAIKESGYKRMYIAEQLGIANQNLNKMINKKSISLDDANKILHVIGYNAQISIQKELKK